MLPLATSTWDSEELEAIQRVIASGMFTMGEQVAECEKAFARSMGADYSVMVNSGSSANLLAIASLFYTENGTLQPGDEVIVPAVSWATTYTPLQQYGLKLKFVDVDVDTLNIDIDQVAEAISPRTKLIVAVNLLGNPVDYAKLNAVINGRAIHVFEDNCESLGAQLSGRKAGTFGLLGSYSSFFSHHISTMEGGFVTTDNEELYHIMLSLRSHGWTRHLPSPNRVCEKSEDPFEESFRFVLPGYNLRPLEFSGALGLTQLKKMPGIVEGRRANAKVFAEHLGSVPGLRIQKETGQSSWFGFSMIIEAGRESRDRLRAALGDMGVECRPIVAGNFTRNSVIKYFDYEIHKPLVTSDLIHDCGFFIGNHHFDISNELQVIADTVKEVLL